LSLSDLISAKKNSFFLNISKSGHPDRRSSVAALRASTRVGSASSRFTRLTLPQRGCFPDLESNIQVSVFGGPPFGVAGGKKNVDAVRAGSQVTESAIVPGLDEQQSRPTPARLLPTACVCDPFLRCSLIKPFKMGRRVSVHWFVGVLQSQRRNCSAVNSATTRSLKLQSCAPSFERCSS
jgi:hypothetical protein